MSSLRLCKKLRWKGYSRDLAGPAAILRALALNRAQYSCLVTCQPWGPDDELAAPECCNDSRPCFEPSPLVTKIGRDPGDPRVS